MPLDPPELKALWHQPDIAAIVSALQPLPVYLVGGAVRDLLLGRPVKDFDFLVDCAAQQLLDLRPQLKQATGCTVIVLDGQRGILRVCQPDSEGLDLAASQGQSVEQDLARRDVTFNALAVATDGRLIDPFAGRRDLDSRLVRITSPDVLHQDPLRVLRCLRLAAGLDFQIEPDTQRTLGQAAPGLAQVAGERISEELRRFLAYAHIGHLQQFRQAHIGSAIWGHSFDETQAPWDWLTQWWQAQPDVPRPPDTVLSILAALLSSFAPHHQAQTERIKLSKAQARYLQTWWAGNDSLRKGHPSTPREIYSLITTAGDSLQGLLTFAVLPASPNPLPQALAQRIKSAANGGGELRWEPLPLGGDDLCLHWNKTPGPWLGRALKELEIAWACKELNDPNSLLAHSKTFL